MQAAKRPSAAIKTSAPAVKKRRHVARLGQMDEQQREQFILALKKGKCKWMALLSEGIYS
jgi:hypothetical protein